MRPAREGRENSAAVLALTLARYPFNEARP